MSNYLVTGAQGFIGRHVTARLLSDPDVEVLGIGRSPESPHTFSYSIRWADGRLPAPLPAELRTVSPRYRYLSVDVTAGGAVRDALRTFRPDVVIHLAAGLRGDAAPDLVRTNVDGTRTLVDAIADAVPDLRKLVLGSTGAVYGAADATGVPFDEAAACRPPDDYAVTKLAAEDAAREWSARHGIPTVCARLFNVLGAGEDDRHVAPEFARQAAEITHRLRPRLIEVGDLGSTRDFIDVRDAARALVTLGAETIAAGTYNIGSGHETSIGSLLDLILDAAGLTGAVEIRRRDGRGVAVRRHVADVRRLRAAGFEPRFALADSARDVLTYYTRTVADAAAAGTIAR